MARTTYTPKFKFNVVLELLRSEKSEAEVARAFDVHPATVSRWKKQFLEQGAEVFGGSEEVKEYEERIGQLERMLGKKEVELALLKNFFFRELSLDERMELVDKHREGHGLNACLRALNVSKGTWHYRMRAVGRRRPSVRREIGRCTSPSWRSSGATRRMGTGGSDPTSKKPSGRWSTGSGSGAC